MYVWNRVFTAIFLINLAICRDQEFNYQVAGVIVSVFTPMDANGNINLTSIPAYANYLKENGANGVLLTSISGEGPNLSVREKKSVYDAWTMFARPLGLSIIIQIGGGSLPDTLELATYANALNVDSILVLPMAFSQPNVEELTNIMDRISEAAPSVPFLYYDIPQYSNVKLDMTKFFSLALGRINMFRGLLTDFATTLEILATNPTPNQRLFVYDYILTTGAVPNGYDSFMISISNIAPQLYLDVIRTAQRGNFGEARPKLLTLIKLEREITARYNYISSMKVATELTTGIRLGNPREPLPPIPEEGTQYIRSILLKYDLSVVL
ncbi:hypothetical protein O3G_MSEX009127 [Manduca sexta]|uniref:N-acetylneuraminate lyase n=2 Tax=Manduca sexta TaxID=7130 RepID=A0A922CRK8_MANSE|nr:hypothetical protein O3G_MSEX009127 [Manduca sexta]